MFQQLRSRPKLFGAHLGPKVIRAYSTLPGPFLNFLRELLGPSTANMRDLLQCGWGAVRATGLWRHVTFSVGPKSRWLPVSSVAPAGAPLTLVIPAKRVWRSNAKRFFH